MTENQKQILELNLTVSIIAIEYYFIFITNIIFIETADI